MEWIKHWLAQGMIKLFDLEQFDYNSISLTQEVLFSITDLARDCHPKEFLAFLGGSVKNKTLVIDKLLYQVYHASEDSAFPEMHLPTLSGCVGSVHSHPGASNRPSDADLHFFDKNPGIHLIIKEPYKPHHVMAYDSKGRKISFKIE
ncbi:Mov34/MPN/PAD-1 family protein [Candidatus Woesearchaeota archaeon]|nr:Mov34/MPN/PAD-1 family protein [Candidatus Woesearchaeota archaeon]